MSIPYTVNSLGNIPPAQKMGIEVPFKNWAEVVKETVIPYKPTRIIPSKPIEIITYSPKVTQKRLPKRKRSAKRRATSPTLSSVRR